MAHTPHEAQQMLLVLHGPDGVSNRVNPGQSAEMVRVVIMIQRLNHISSVMCSLVTQGNPLAAGTLPPFHIGEGRKRSAMLEMKLGCEK